MRNAVSASRGAGASSSAPPRRVPMQVHACYKCWLGLTQPNTSSRQLIDPKRLTPAKEACLKVHPKNDIQLSYLPALHRLSTTAHGLPDGSDATSTRGKASSLDSDSDPDVPNLKLPQYDDMETGSGGAEKGGGASTDPKKGEKEEEEEEEHNFAVRAALVALRFYKTSLSPNMQSSCRYLPTCSEYSVQSYKKFGFWQGSVLTGWRILRCNPWSGRGYDPPTWPPKGLALIYGEEEGGGVPYAPEVTVVAGTWLFVYIVQGLLHDLGF